MRILSIDDSRAVHAYLTQCLGQTDLKIEHAYSGEEGMGILAADANFDLILLDWEMPGLTGPEVLVKIKSIGVEAPIIMLTSKNKVEDITAMLSFGASEYIMKPFTPDILLDKIEAVKGVVITRHDNE